MAEADWGNVHAPATDQQPPQGPSFVSWAGAFVSVALIAGLAVWGYKLAVRDVTGVPVVRALEGPMRVQPEDPGGEAAAHMGLSVNNVQADGQAEATADTLALAPRPVDLTSEDLPVETTARIEAPVSAPAQPVEELVEQAVSAALNGDLVVEDPAAAALALAEALSEGVEPLEAITDTVAAIVEPALPAQPAQPDAGPRIIPASVPGVTRSPRPAHRPADLPIPTSAPAPAQGQAATVQEVSADAIPVGTRLVQLGAFENPEIARAEWIKLSERFEEYLVGKSRVIEQASSGGKTFFRLRAMGFSDLSDARRFCSVLMAGKAACIPVVTR